jgi:hypothetical protein
MPASGDFDARIVRLEREARVWRAAAVASVLLATVAWLVPSVSAQPQTIRADRILAREIYVVRDLLDPAPAAATGISLRTDANGANVLVNGPSARVAVFGPAPGAPFASMNADAGSAWVTASDASHGLVTVGYLPGQAGAFRAFDSTSGDDPVWSAP